MKYDRESKLEVSREERSILASGKKINEVLRTDYSIACFQNVWDWANLRRGSETDLVRVLTVNRGEKCFFYDYTPGMFFPAAVELERREADRREACQDRKVAKWNIVFGLVGIVVGVILTAIITKILN
jgi:hypothetical protein